MKICVFGLGKLGSVIAAVHAAVGHEVIGIDLDSELVEDVREGRASTAEPGLQDLMHAASSRLTASTDPSEAMEGADLSFVIVPTPSDATGVFSNAYVVSCLQTIGESLRKSKTRHVVVICSTVMPGSCDGELREALEQSSGRRVGDDVGLVYSPEFIALGSVVHDMQYPDLVLIGESDPLSGALVEEIALSIVHNAPSVLRMSNVNAEIVKIAINTFVTTKISYANMLGEICDKLPGADVDVVTQAVGSDSRIGSKYLKGALGYGGPCFPRDNVALTRLSEALQIDAAIPRATDLINSRQIDRVVNLVSAHVAPNSIVAVLGLSYKPDTPVCEESQGVGIANGLADAGYSVLAFDPQASADAATTLKSTVRTVGGIEDAVAPASCVVISTAWTIFRSLNREQLAGKVVVDPWNVLNGEIQAIRLGKLSSYIKSIG